MNKDIQVLRKVLFDYNKFDWKELHIHDKAFKAINFPSDAEQFVNAFITTPSPSNKISIIVGIYRKRFYSDEEKYTFESRKYAAILTTTSDVVFNSFFIDEIMYIRESKVPDFYAGIPFDERTNIIQDLYDKVSRKANNVDQVYDDFLNS